MSPALWILFSVLFVLLFLLFSPIRLVFCYDGRIKLTLHYLFLHFSLVPRKKKKNTKKEPVKKKKEKKKDRKKAGKDAQRAEKPVKKKKKPLRFSDIRFLLRLVRGFLSRTVQKLRKHMRIRIRRLHITLGGGEDAAKAAIEYGIAAQALAYLLAVPEEAGVLKKKKDIRLDIDFLSDSAFFDTRIEVIFPLFFAVSAAVSILFDGLRTYTRFKKRPTGKKAKDSPAVSRVSLRESQKNSEKKESAPENSP